MTGVMNKMGDIKGESIIIVAPNGARKTKQDHPNLPISVNELVDEVRQCVGAGASMVHLHARKGDGSHSLEIEDNLQVYQAVKSALGDQVIVQLTTEAVGVYSPDQQMALIRNVRPEAASFALVELIPDESHEQAASEFFHWLTLQHITSQYIVYSPEQLSYYLDLKERGVLPDTHHHLLFVLGRYHKQQLSEPSDLDPFLDYIDQLDDVRWAVCAFGVKEQECLLKAASYGGDVRVGFENNLHKANAQLAESNAEQVKDLSYALEKSGRAIMNVKAARKALSFA
ncbi:beta-keto acid cleavage family enzyme [Marinomonas epiphytica]